jgi:hypothetical protein
MKSTAQDFAIDDGEEKRGSGCCTWKSLPRAQRGGRARCPRPNSVALVPPSNVNSVSLVLLVWAARSMEPRMTRIPARAISLNREKKLSLVKFNGYHAAGAGICMCGKLQNYHISLLPCVKHGLSSSSHLGAVTESKFWVRPACYNALHYGRNVRDECAVS